MEEISRAQIFEAQTTNVRDLERAWLHLNRQINVLIIQKNHKGIEITTKLLAVIYCALAEAIFSKLLHTHGVLTLGEIDQVKEVIREKGITNGWQKCAELAVQKIDSARSNHAPNVLQKLQDLIHRYIYDPSILRNKLAHGQWTIALNRDNDDVNPEITALISQHSVVELARRKRALERLVAILEDIIESPKKAHKRDYWIHISEFEAEQEKMGKWTFQAKVAGLEKKKSYSVMMS